MGCLIRKWSKGNTGNTVTILYKQLYQNKNTKYISNLCISGTLYLLQIPDLVLLNVVGELRNSFEFS